MRTHCGELRFNFKLIVFVCIVYVFLYVLTYVHFFSDGSSNIIKYVYAVIEKQKYFFRRKCSVCRLELMDFQISAYDL